MNTYFGIERMRWMSKEPVMIIHVEYGRIESKQDSPSDGYGSIHIGPRGFLFTKKGFGWGAVGENNSDC